MANDSEREKPGVVEGTAKAVAAIVKEVPVYKDAVQPLAQEAGKALAVPVSLINTALRPLTTMMLGFNLIFDRLNEAMKRRLAGVPPEKIVEPPTNVAAPLLLGYAFAESEPPLREMFEQLLATAMNADTRDKAHPSFVDLITQLTSAEAGLLVEIYRRGKSVPVLQVGSRGPDYEQGTRPIMVLSDLEAVHFERFPACAGNLERLGLVEMSFTDYLVAPGAYEKVEAGVAYVGIKAVVESQGRFLDTSQGFLSVTPFGDDFVAAVVPPPPGLEVTLADDLYPEK